jgi:phospholipid/cholesterol/gamma-HCH transport system substrate-binding protein
MRRLSKARTALAVGLVALLVCAGVVILRGAGGGGQLHMVAYFANSNGVFAGDDVRILGVPVGKIDKIEPQPTRAKISFWVDDKYKVPADAKAVVLSPTLVTARVIQLTPAYVSGPAMQANAVIPEERTAVPVEWDDFRKQLEKLTTTLQPTKPGGVSTLGALVDTAADNLRGQGANIRQTIVELSQAISALGDHSTDIFSTIKNLSILVSALHDSADVMRQLNRNLSAVTGLLADNPDAIAQSVKDVNDVAAEVTDFVAQNRESLGTATDKLASISTAVTQSMDDVKQALHVFPNALVNLNSIYEPAQAALTGILAANNFANPISFLCGAIQAASRLGAEQSAKLCVQYLAPIIKNRQYNYPPLGENLFVGAEARPNELTYSEDWMRPDYIPPPPPGGTAPPQGSGDAALPATPPQGPPLPAEAPGPAGAAPTPPMANVPINPAGGLTGLMTPPGGGQ